MFSKGKFVDFELRLKRLLKSNRYVRIKIQNDFFFIFLFKFYAVGKLCWDIVTLIILAYKKKHNL